MSALTPVPRLEQTELVNLKKSSIWQRTLQNTVISSPQGIVAVQDGPVAETDTWHHLGLGVDHRQGRVQESHRPQVRILFQDDSNLERTFLEFPKFEPINKRNIRCQYRRVTQSQYNLQVVSNEVKRNFKFLYLYKIARSEVLLK